MNLALPSTILFSITSGVSSKFIPQATIDCFNDCEGLGDDEAISLCRANCYGQTGRLRGTKQLFPPDQPLTCRETCDLLNTGSRNSCYREFNCPPDNLEVASASFAGRPTEPVMSICEACDSFQSVISRQVCLDFYDCVAAKEDNDSHISLQETEPTDVCELCDFFLTERARRVCYDFNNCNNKESGAKLEYPGPGPNPPTSGHSLFDCFTTCEAEINVPDCIQQRCFDAEVAISSSNNRPTERLDLCETCEFEQLESSRQLCLFFFGCRDASLQEESYVKGAAPGSGSSFLNCVLSCEAERNVADCLNQRCFGSETAFVDDEEETPVSIAPLRGTAPDVDFQEYVKQAGLNEEAEKAEFASTSTTCLPRGSNCNNHRDCCNKFCTDVYFPPRCLI